MEVKFYNEVNDSLLKFAVIVAKYNGKWVFCKHRERYTYECPGGHRDDGEVILETAKRELYEETGALSYKLDKITTYSVVDDTKETYGMLYYAEIHEMGELPESEIEQVILFDELPSDWTYPLIQPHLIKKVIEFLETE